MKTTTSSKNSNVPNLTFIDRMDTTRYLRPVDSSADGKNFVCRVYFKESKNGSPNYAGKTEVPKSLFTTEPESTDYRYAIPDFLISPKANFDSAQRERETAREDRRERRF